MVDECVHEQLFRIVKEGLATIALGYETDMPAYASILDDAQIAAILDYIKGTWPERERDIQQSRRPCYPMPGLQNHALQLA